MRSFAIQARRLFTGTEMLSDQTVVGAAGTVLGLGTAAPDGARLVRLPDDAILAPGFVDLQVNGGGGVLFNDAIDRESLARIAAAHLRAGTTSILPTLISGSRGQIRAAIQVTGDALGAGDVGIAGLHLEGPFLNPARRGIHPAAALAVPDEADIDLLSRAFPGGLLITLAPEMTPAGTIERLTAAGRVVFAGHTEMDFEQAQAALTAGLSGFTHLFNAMSQLTARAPGAVGAALTSPHARAGIILDGLHVHPQAARLALSAMGPGRLFLVSDAMPTVGSRETGFNLAGMPIRLVDGRLRDAAGTLAGAHLTMAEAVANAVRLLGCTLADALRMASATPAAAIGMADRIGHIRAGMRADLVALDASLRPIAVWAGGVRMEPP